MKIAFVDHYDSFSFNVLDCLMKAGISHREISHFYCDDLEGLAFLRVQKMPTVFGPGPHAPKDLPQSAALVKDLMAAQVPLFGVCLGHQIFGHVTGAKIVASKNPWHGSTIEAVITDKHCMFEGIETPLTVACYNSLVVEASTLGGQWNVTATNTDQEVMAMSHSDPKLLVWSVQFHPESFLSQRGEVILRNWFQKITPAKN